LGKTAKGAKRHLLLAFVPEAGDGFLESGNLARQVAKQVKRRIHLQWQAGEHAEPQNHVYVRPSLLNGFSREFGTNFGYKPFWWKGCRLRQHLGHHRKILRISPAGASAVKHW